MQKLQISVPIGKWGTLKTKYPVDSNIIDPADFTAGTKNLQTSVKGLITKRPGGVIYSTLSTSAKDQYEAIFSDGVHHLLTVDDGILNYSTGNQIEHQALSGLSDSLYNEFVTIQDRIYFSNGVTAKIYDRTTSYGGVSYTFPTNTIKDIGCQIPQSGVTFAADSSGGSVPVGGHHYKITFVYYGSEESNGGPASALHTITGPDQTVHLTAIPTGGYGVTARNIYRDDNDGIYVLIGTINDNTTTTFTDSINAGLTPIPEFNDIPSAFTLCNLWNESLFIAGIPGDPYTLFYSNPFTPDIFDPDNTINCSQIDPITGVVVYLGRQIVFNRRSMGQILGNTPDTYRYSEIDPSIGCVDVRSIQIRVINGIPLLVWLSDKGVYVYDGSSITYISDEIEDQINFNIKQVVVQKNKITQSTITDFQQGTSTDGINLLVSPGDIETKGPLWDTTLHPLATVDEQTNPTITFDSDVDWDDGSDIENAATQDGLNTLKNVQPWIPTLASGSLTGTAYIDGSNVKLPLVPDFTGENHADEFIIVHYTNNIYNETMQSIQPPRAGTLTGFTLKHITGSMGDNVRLTIRRDNSGSPGALIYTGSTYIFSHDEYINLTVSGLNISVATNEKIWIGVQHPWGVHFQVGGMTSAVFTNQTVKSYDGFGWVDTIMYGGTTVHSLYVGYTFISTIVGKIGSWISPIFDSKSISLKSLTINAGSTSFPDISTAGDLVLEATNDPLFLTGISIYTLNNPSGLDTSFPYDNLRFYRFSWNLTTNDDRYVPTVPAPQISAFPTAIWISPVIDCSDDVTSYDVLSMVSSGSGNTVTIATSDDGINFSSYSILSLAIVKQYVKIKLLVGSGLALISSVTFSWSLASTFISDAIDTGVTPSGWDIFQADYQTNGSTVVFYMKSAASSGGLSGATWYTVANGFFPTPSIPVYEWVQYKAEITASVNKVPVIHSVTINWFIGNNDQIRVASIFYNKSYFLAASEFGNSYNNIIFELDFEGKWRVHKDMNISTLSYFFNSPYYGDSVTGDIVKFFEGLQDKGNAINLEIYTKAYEFSTEYVNNAEKVKILNEVLLQLGNTGATFTVYFSTDTGTTWYMLYNNNGDTTWILPTNNKMSFIRLRPDYTLNIPYGQSIMLRISNDDSKEVQIQSLKLEAFIRKQKNVITG
jgi:hypothetical protein